jgi:hypothetical protein
MTGIVRVVGIGYIKRRLDTAMILGIYISATSAAKRKSFIGRGKSMIKTTEKYYCDRCGKELDKQPQFYTKRLSLLSRQFSLRKLNDSWECVDLCDDCKKSLIEWWNEGKK